MGDGYMCGRNVKMKESLSHFCGISFLPKWDFFFCGLQIPYLFTTYLVIIVCKGTDNCYELQAISKGYNDYSRYFVILPLSWSREISQTLVLYSADKIRSSASSRLFWASRISIPERSPSR